MINNVNGVREQEEREEKRRKELSMFLLPLCEPISIQFYHLPRTLSLSLTHSRALFMVIVSECSKAYIFPPFFILSSVSFAFSCMCEQAKALNSSSIEIAAGI